MTELKSWEHDFCDDCLLLKRCGGDSAPSLFGRGCHTGGMVGECYSNDDMHPAHPERFTALLKDVDGLDSWKFDEFRTPNSFALPSYIPKLENGCRRVLLLEAEWVALPLFKILRRRANGSYGPRFHNGEELRRAYRLAPSTQIIAVGVGIDRWLERFWRDHLSGNALAELASLGLAGVTAPNFSMFSDVTRFQHARNQKRMLIACERMSKVGIAVIPHLNASWDGDWIFWTQFMAEHPEIKYVSKEFQTGLSNQNLGEHAIERLATLSFDIGRQIHPILIGGGKYFRFATEQFGKHFSIIDSRPFMLAMSRKVFRYGESGFPLEKPVTTLPGQGIDHLLYENLLNYPSIMESGLPRKSVEKNDACQQELLFANSSPNFTDQPVAEGISERYFETMTSAHSSRGRQMSSK